MIVIAAFLLGLKFGNAGKFIVIGFVLQTVLMFGYEAGFTLETIGAAAALLFLLSPIMLMMFIHDENE